MKPILLNLRFLLASLGIFWLLTVTPLLPAMFKQIALEMGWVA
ncbi:hypothetical protein [Shewanella gelidii]|nr:hypothetical protein [Shewanella gelidii]